MERRRLPFLTLYATFTLSVLGATAFQIGGIFAGRTAVLLQRLNSQFPWIFLMYPLMLTVRGDINGILSGKLGTALHLGTIKPQWKNNTEQLKYLIGLVFTITIFDSLFVGTLAFIFGMIFSIQDTQFLVMILISISTFLIASLISMALTISLSFFVFRRNADPDVFILPVTATINDVLITLIFFGIASLYTTAFRFYIGVPLNILAILLVGIIVYNFQSVQFYRNSLFQALPTLLVTATIAAGTGTVLTSFSSIIAEYPVLLTVYPAVNSLIGNQGAILANTTTTKLHLGAIEPKFAFIQSQEFTIPFLGILTAGLIMSIFYSIFGAILAPEKEWTIQFFFSLLLLLLLTNLLAYSVITVIAISSAFLTYKLGLDPDNLVIPILTSTADLISTSALVGLAILIFI